MIIMEIWGDKHCIHGHVGYIAKYKPIFCCDNNEEPYLYTSQEIEWY